MTDVQFGWVAPEDVHALCDNALADPDFESLTLRRRPDGQLTTLVVGRTTEGSETATRVQRG